MRLNPFRQADFLYFYSLQAGVVICSSIGIFLAITSLIVNLASENSEIENNIIVGQYILVSFYCVISLLGFLLGLVSAYQEKFSVIYVSISLQALMLLYWLVLLILSFHNHPYFTRRICIQYRCADHLWIQDARWRYYVIICDPEDRNLPVIYHPTAASVLDKYLNVWGEPDHHEVSKNTLNKDESGGKIQINKPANKTHMSKTQINKPPNKTDTSKIRINKPANKTDMTKMSNWPILADGDVLPAKRVLQSDDVGILPGVSEKVWDPQSDFGKGGLLAISIIFSIMLTAFFVYSITTLISYRNELKALEWSEDN
ncbi:uncharacterized protein LOC106662670 isoform X1 [Cimex lectularius]|uniref:Uncharacterized protein n=1 Tax=Cimex lectularius TaxID=79782 RepID=A0A8I6RC06_CIMLE|nr:uncharacterized protein LOC106662670 isoform X1 [Cimex lectularius]XP_014242385.1 uncharacterized protein LOC106662670 isoform X1 [Cimex lectularius]